MGVPFLLSTLITYAAGAVVLLPFQVIFFAYDGIVFFRRAVRFTNKSIYHFKHYRANQRSKKHEKHAQMRQTTISDWVIAEDAEPNASENESEWIELTSQSR